MSGSSIEGVEKLDHAFDAWVARIEEATKTALIAAGAAVAQTTAAGFGKSPAPTSRSGALASSIATSDPKRAGHGYTVEIGPSGVVYARRQELGKSGKGHSGAHPYFKPGFESATDRFIDIFTNAWHAAAPKEG